MIRLNYLQHATAMPNCDWDSGFQKDPPTHKTAIHYLLKTPTTFHLDTAHSEIIRLTKTKKIFKYTVVPIDMTVNAKYIASYYIHYVLKKLTTLPE